MMALIPLLAIYVIVASIGCSPTAVASHEALNLIGIDSEIAGADVAGRGTYCHIFLIIDGESYEPRYLGLHKRPNIDYEHPRFKYESTEDYLDAGYDLFPSLELIVTAAREAVGAT